jgi:mRNA interferase MazF
VIARGQLWWADLGLPRGSALPGNVTVPADAGLLPADSVVNVTQLATVDRLALEDRIGELPDWLLSQVDAGLQRALGLPRS